MESLKGRVALVTGASAGIGEACARALAGAGAHVVVAARRRERVEALARELEGEHGVRALAVALDVRDRSAVEAALAPLPEPFTAVDILVNNAGLGRGMDKLYQGDPSEWDEMVDTNVKGLLYVTRCLVPGMVARGHGHVVNLGSVAGREVYPGGNVYCATKFAVRALTGALKMDLLGTPVRVTTVDPGMVETEFSMVRFRGDRERAAKVYENLEALRPEDVADAVLWAVTRPPRVDVTEIVVMPTAQSSALLNHRGPLVGPEKA